MRSCRSILICTTLFILLCTSAALGEEELRLSFTPAKGTTFRLHETFSWKLDIGMPGEWVFKGESWTHFEVTNTEEGKGTSFKATESRVLLHFEVGMQGKIDYDSDKKADEPKLRHPALGPLVAAYATKGAATTFRIDALGVVQGSIEGLDKVKKKVLETMGESAPAKAFRPLAESLYSQAARKQRLEKVFRLPGGGALKKESPAILSDSVFSIPLAGDFKAFEGKGTLSATKEGMAFLANKGKLVWVKGTGIISRGPLGKILKTEKGLVSGERCHHLAHGFPWRGSDTIAVTMGLTEAPKGMASLADLKMKISGKTSWAVLEFKAPE